mgnify:FL=1
MGDYVEEVAFPGVDDLLHFRQLFVAESFFVNTPVSLQVELSLQGTDVSRLAEAGVLSITRPHR